VGLLYGPSGSGKSSLVKAGLLPRLRANVVPVYVEATAEKTEGRLLHGLRKACGDLAAPQFAREEDGADLKDILARLRRGQGLAAGKKVLLVIDQFEQWLHARRGEKDTVLVQALRQCEGGRVQALLLVRDDFWLAVTRFLAELEVDLLQGHNTAPVDLFDLDHARNVLAAFGRAFGKLPENPSQISRDHREFLRRAIADLAQESKVTCVRLALFAEMMKGKPWTPLTLKQVGGSGGVGVTFLEETFSSATANPKHRLHQRAARAVLGALLPESGTDIKGHMRSYSELLATSSYVNRPKDFDDLIHILDGEIRLITPTEVAEPLPDEHARPAFSADSRYYQLTHDYLVPVLRDWLTRKQKETRRGRAELLLADRASIWQTRPENRQLPSLGQWLSIRTLTQQERWTDPQREMMRRATRYHAVRCLAIGALFVIAALIGTATYSFIQEQKRADHAQHLVRRLLDANIAQVPDIISEIEELRGSADPLLKQQYRSAKNGSDAKLRTSLALLPIDPHQTDYLYQHLLFHTQKNPEAVPVLRNALSEKRQALVERLWDAVEKPELSTAGQRLRAAALLARYDPANPRWERNGGPVAEDLVSENPIFSGIWLELFRPVRTPLLRPLTEIFRDRSPERSSETRAAASLLAEYADDQPETLADLLMDADVKQFAVLFPRVKDLGAEAQTLFAREIGKPPLGDSPDAKNKLAQRQANAAVALFKMGNPDKVWPLLKHRPDPSMRTYVIHGLGPLEADPMAIINRLKGEKNVEIRRALFLSLGEFTDRQLSPEARNDLLPMLGDEYRHSEDPGIHSAVEWLLRRWDQKAWIEKTNKEWAEDKPAKENALSRIADALKTENGNATPRWYVNGQGQTMVVIPGPGEFMMGSPDTEAGRVGNEQLHRRHIGRTFAIAAKPVTFEEFLRFRKAFEYEKLFAPDPKCPAVGMTWYVAAEYCNWLSEQEGLPPSERCFEPNEKRKYDDGMKLAPDYLKRRGYRLPTEAEWEDACRAGSTTSRYYGDSTPMLVKYGWYMVNAQDHSWPVGMLKPNDWGLFDMHGNSWNWCLDRFAKSYPLAPAGKAAEDFDPVLTVSDKEIRTNRGGAFGTHAADVRSATRGDLLPTSFLKSVGFRPARTIRSD
jgi:formylglycine-generating enzyme required for sulfatase activity